MGMERAGTLGMLAVAALVVIGLSVFSGTGPLQKNLRMKRSLEAAVALRHPFDDIAGKPAPEMRWHSIDGGDVDLHAVAAKTVIFVFSLDYCPPCDSELSALRQLAAESRFSGVRVIGIVRQLSGRDIPQAELLARLRIMPSDFPLVLDSAETDAKLGNIKAVPVTIYIDGSGTVVKQVMSQQYSDLEATISRLR
jgi:peroxiredoxin